MSSAEPAPPAVKPPDKPTLRGVLHQWAAVAAVGAGAVLVASAHSGRGAVAAGVFALCLVALFAVSATYHRVRWKGVGRERMRRLDHASIFLLIAGTYTPVAMLGLPPTAGNNLLLLIWPAAGVGILQATFWIRAPKLVGTILAIAVGWAIVPYSGDLRAALPTSSIVLIVAGGVAYTLGAVAYAAKRPNPVAGVFGYHEVFHAMTLVGAALHFALVLQLVRAERLG